MPCLTIPRPRLTPPNCMKFFMFLNPSNSHTFYLKKTFFRYTHNEKRYHSEVRQEAVQQALAAIQLEEEAEAGRKKGGGGGGVGKVPMASKRASVMNRSR